MGPLHTISSESQSMLCLIPDLGVRVGLHPREPLQEHVQDLGGTFHMRSLLGWLRLGWLEIAQITF